MSKHDTKIKQEDNTLALFEFRKLMLQLDRKRSRKKAIAGLKRFAYECSDELEPHVWLGLAMGHVYDGEFEKSIFYCKQAIATFPLSPASLFCSSFLIHLYRILGMRKQRFEEEGVRVRMMKKLALQSEDPEHRIMALEALKKEFEERDLLQHFEYFYDQLPTDTSVEDAA
jgi:hypothetical protein